MPDWQLCGSGGFEGQEQEGRSEHAEDALVLAFRAVDESLQISQEVFNNHRHPDFRTMMSEKDVELYTMFKKSAKKASASKKAGAKDAIMTKARSDDLHRVQAWLFLS